MGPHGMVRGFLLDNKNNCMTCVQVTILCIPPLLKTEQVADTPDVVTKAYIFKYIHLNSEEDTLGVRLQGLLIYLNSE